MNKQPSQRPIRVGMISLGCAKNLVDAEIMVGSLLKSGLELTNDPKAADVVIVNTCSFIDSAQEESVDTILESSEIREAHHHDQALIVSGCLSQRFREDLPKLLPEVDAFMGIDQVERVGEVVREALARRAEKIKKPALRSKTRSRKQVTAKLNAAKAAGAAEEDAGLRGTAEFGKTKVVVGAATAAPLVEVHQRPTYIPDYATPRFRLTPNHFAYLKIAEGCNHPCSFCIIPRMRGTHRSRQPMDVLREARALVGEGVRELNLISQDSTYYGLDLRAQASRAIASPERFRAAVEALPGQSPTLASLVRQMNELPGDFWIRLLYTHPAHWTDDLIRAIAESRKVARYIDIPLQHIHENMLERMRRETTRKHIEELLARLRAGIPGVALRTTFIVGFPGETEEYFESLLEFIRTVKFERLGVFTYSQEEGTRAGKMSGQIPEKVRHDRRDRAMAAQREVAREVSQTFVGRELRVLIEKQAGPNEMKAATVQSWKHGQLRGDGDGERKLRGKWYVARGEADAPDIDGRVYVHGTCVPGEFAKVKVTGHTDYDLLAEIDF